MSIDRTKYMSLEEVHKLQAYAKSKGGLVWMVVDMALNTGLRVSELASIRIEDIDFDRQFITITRLKKRQSKPENMAIGIELLDHLRSWTVGRSGALFIGQRGKLTRQGLQKVWKKAVIKAGLNKDYSIHSARHTIAVHLLKKTKNLRHVQKQLGHSSPATTANMYADVSFEEMQTSLNGLY